MNKATLASNLGLTTSLVGAALLISATYHTVQIIRTPVPAKPECMQLYKEVNDAQNVLVKTSTFPQSEQVHQQFMNALNSTADLATLVEQECKEDMANYQQDIDTAQEQKNRHFQAVNYYGTSGSVMGCIGLLIMIGASITGDYKRNSQ